MSYISLSFFVFLICLLIFYRIAKDQDKWKVLLLFSIIFYASNGTIELLFILGTSLVVYAASRHMEKIWLEYESREMEQDISAKEKKEARQKYTLRSKRTLQIALFVCVGILCWCKFGAKSLKAINQITNHSWVMRIIIPLGVSYYTFSSIGYLTDVHWRKVQTEHNYPKLLLSMIYFPHVVQGPIASYDKFLPQLGKLSFPDYQRFCMGVQLVLWGLFKKLVIADRLSIFVDSVFGDINKSQGFIVLIALFLAAFQTYADFSGCMDIVTGISDVLGIQLERNFNHPFFSKSAAEFWRRWHITLGNWFKNYIYVPITTSSMIRTLRRKANKRFGAKGVKTVMTVIPFSVVWLLTGIWHGTGKNYVVWGMYWGGMIICASLFEDDIKKVSQFLHIDTNSKGWGYFQMVRTFCLYMSSLLAIVPGSLRKSLTAFRQMIGNWNPWIFWDGSLYNYGLDRRNFLVAIFSILFLIFVEVLQERMNVREMISRRNIVLRWTVYYLGIFSILILGIYGPGYDASSFIYENF